MAKLLEKLDWPLVIIFTLGLGLAPFTPPHLYEKVMMLRHGELVAPLDWFDLFMHGTPWIVLLLKSYFSLLDVERSL